MGFPQPVQAGIGPADVVVVVNGGSFNSRTLANHYVSLRQIPAINVIVLQDVPSSEIIGVEEFRSKILRPLLLEVERRKLANHIQCIAYSADFPTSIDISADLKGVEPLHQVFTKQASINSLTYFYALVLGGSPDYIALNANFYARSEVARYFTNPGGGKTQAAWDSIQALIGSGKHAEAADALEKMLGEHPHQFPLAYAAAAEAAEAGNKKRAIELLRKSVGLGWNASHYLRKDGRFDSLRELPEFQVLEFLLDDSIKELQPASGFDARKAWAPNGVFAQDPQFGMRYLLSTVLGVTRGAGTSLVEAIESLQRSARADFSHPQGGFYFCLTGDVRTTTRQWGFIGAVDDLQQMGFQAEIVKQVLPTQKTSVLGVQLGAPTFDWSSSGSQLAPGAIADNLTSLGGVMSPGAGQTNLSELIRAGAAGSSGAVTEPYALQEKFPHPQMYVHYARGASLAEAFYLSVTGPYQLLIVGDPLCRPFSHAPQPALDLSLRKIKGGENVWLEPKLDGVPYIDWLEGGDVKLAQRTDPLAALAVRVLFDGVQPMAGPAKPRLNIKIVDHSPGYHELFLQFYADDPFAQCSSATLPLWVGEEGLVEMNLLDSSPGRSGFEGCVSLQAGSAQVKVKATSGQRVSVWHDGEQLAVAAEATAEFSLPLELLGMGPVRLQPKAELEDGTVVQGRPLWLEVLP